MTLRYRVTYVGEHVVHLEAENGMIHDVPLEWMPVEIEEGQVLLVETDSLEGTSTTRFGILEDRGR